jgi:hypothetical protein
MVDYSTSTHIRNYHHDVISLNYQPSEAMCMMLFSQNDQKKVAVSYSGIQDVMCKLCTRNSIPVLQKSMLYTTMQMNSYKTASTYSA